MLYWISRNKLVIGKDIILFSVETADGEK